MRYIKLYENFEPISMETIIFILEYRHYFNIDPDEDAESIEKMIEEMAYFTPTTLEYLKGLGVNILYRGLKTRKINDNDLPFTSWTFNKEIAESFGGKIGDQKGVVIHKAVNDLKVLFSMDIFFDYVKNNCYDTLEPDLKKIVDEYVSENEYVSECEVICLSESFQLTPHNHYLVNEANISGTDIVYHGTSKNAWKKKYEGESTLYLSNDIQDAQSYAYEMAGSEELDDIKPEPIVCSITITELKKLKGIELDPDWGGFEEQVKATWKDTYEKYGSFSIHGDIESIKNKFTVTPVKTDF